jgi:hypothetical protein
MRSFKFAVPFLAVLCLAGAADAQGRGPGAGAGPGPGAGMGPGRMMTEQERALHQEMMRKRWEEMTPEQRDQAMQRFHERRTMRWEDMQRQWDAMPPQDRQRFMERRRIHRP